MCAGHKSLCKEGRKKRLICPRGGRRWVGEHPCALQCGIGAMAWWVLLEVGFPWVLWGRDSWPRACSRWRVGGGGS